MQVIGIVGSPRHGKNTATLVARALEAAQSTGMETALYYVNDYAIAPCQGCDGCKQTAVCVQHDGMDILYRALEEARGLVLGTPIYLDHVSAQTKTFLDRLYAYLGPNLENHFPSGYKAVIVATWGDGNPHAYDDVAAWIRRRLSGYWGIATVAEVAVASADARPMAEQTDALRRAYDAGIALAESLLARGEGR